MEEQNNEVLFETKDIDLANVVIRVSKRMQVAKVPKNIFDQITNVLNSTEHKIENILSKNQYLQVVRDALLEEKEREINRQNNMIRTLKLNGISGYAVSSIIVIAGLAILFVLVFMISKAMLS